MKENPYDRDSFFQQYAGMARSQQGLAGAGEWYALKRLLPDPAGMDVLDLGCGFGWHCAWAAEQGAASVLGIDLSEKMLAEAAKRCLAEQIRYRCCAIEDYEYPADSFDLVVSSLAFHYIEDFVNICRGVAHTLRPGGRFVFSVEHPVFTAEGRQDWLYGEDGNIRCWPVDRYFSAGPREAVFLGEKMTKYHRTLTQYVGALLAAGFKLSGLVEPEPDPAMLHLPGMADELRRPMMLLVSAELG